MKTHTTNLAIKGQDLRKVIPFKSETNDLILTKQFMKIENDQYNLHIRGLF